MGQIAIMGLGERWLDCLWRELLRTAAEGLVVAVRPLLPWLGGALRWPTFLRNADVKDLFRAESIFWSAAHSLLKQGRLKSDRASNRAHDLG